MGDIRVVFYRSPPACDKLSLKAPITPILALVSVNTDSISGINTPNDTWEM